MREDITPKVNGGRSTKVVLTEAEWDLATRLVEQENRRSPLYKVSLRGVVNAAVREYCEARIEAREQAIA